MTSTTYSSDRDYYIIIEGSNQVRINEKDCDWIWRNMKQYVKVRKKMKEGGVSK